MNENDILISRSGSLGLVDIVDKTVKGSVISSHIIRVVLKDGMGIVPKYLIAFFRSRFGQSQFFRKKIGTVVPEIDHDALKSILIPFPPREIQDKIASMMDEAYKAKKEKEAEAEELLNSINDYVRNELDIKLPRIKEEKIFSITFDKIKGRRFDPYSHQPRFEKAYDALSAGKYELKSVGELISDISGGATPKAKGDSYIGPEGIPFLRIQNVTPDGISFEEMNYINEQTHEGLLKRSQLKGGDIVLTITGRIGTVAVIPKNWGKGNINQHIVRLRFKEDILTDFFAAFFNTDFGNQQALRLTSGGSRIALDYNALRSLKIPLPPLPIQKRIANEVRERRERAKKLKEEAKELLEKAKKEVERLIEGK